LAQATAATTPAPAPGAGDGAERRRRGAVQQQQRCRAARSLRGAVRKRVHAERGGQECQQRRGRDRVQRQLRQERCGHVRTGASAAEQNSQSTAVACAAQPRRRRLSVARHPARPLAPPRAQCTRRRRRIRLRRHL